MSNPLRFNIFKSTMHHGHPWIFQSTKISNYLLKLKVLAKKKDNWQIGDSGKIMELANFKAGNFKELNFLLEISNIFASGFPYFSCNLI
jgi:hypothetical protein